MAETFPSQQDKMNNTFSIKYTWLFALRTYKSEVFCHLFVYSHATAMEPAATLITGNHKPEKI